MLVIAEYPGPEAAKAAVLGFAERFQGGGRGAGRREDGYYASLALPGAGNACAFVVRAASREMAEALLAEAAAKGGQP